MQQDPVRASSRARSPTVCGVPLQTLNAPGTGSSAVRASTFAWATSSTCTKSRVWPPSSNTRGARPASSADRKIAATPLYGVSLGMPGP